jgi:hypothetical protein
MRTRKPIVAIVVINVAACLFGIAAILAVALGHGRTCPGHPPPVLGAQSNSQLAARIDHSGSKATHFGTPNWKNGNV